MRFKRDNSLSEILPRPVAFVFSGGTSLGAVQVGMLMGVFEANIVPDLLVGTSVGAINAASVGQGFTKSRLQHLASIWSGLKTSDVFGRTGLKSALSLLAVGLLSAQLIIFSGFWKRTCPIPTLILLFRLLWWRRNSSPAVR